MPQLLLLAALLGLQDPGEVVGDYTLSLGAVDATEAAVSARVHVRDGRLAAGFGGAFDWQRGWADFVRDLEVTAVDGRAITITSTGQADKFAWLISESSGTQARFEGEVDLHYRVDLTYAHREWSFGNEQAGIVLDGALYTVTKGLFLGSPVAGTRRVTFDVPADWRIAAPWVHLEGRTYSAPDLLAVQNNAILLGEFASFELERKGFALTLALPGAMGKNRALIEEALDRVLPAYFHVFPDTVGAPYLMTVYHAGQEDGEAFSNGATFTTTQEISASTSLLWANFLAHELFHYWNGQQIRGEPRSERQWLSEGFTEYYANLACVNGGVLSEEHFLKKVEQHLANYLYFMTAPPFSGVTLREAGSAKGTNRFGVYSGGWATAFVLDHELRSATEGERSLDDFMRVLFERHARPAEPYSFEELAAYLVDVGGLGLEGFLATYVGGREVLPVQDVLHAYGLVGLSKPYAGEFYVVPDGAAGEPEAAAWRWLTRERFR